MPKKLEYKIFDSLMDGVVILDDQHNLIYVNPAAADLIKFPLRRIKFGEPFSKYFKFHEPAWLGDLKDIHSATHYRETNLSGTESHLPEVVRVSIQPMNENGSPPQHWVLYIRNLSLEAHLHKKYQHVRVLKDEAIEAANKDPLTQIYNKRALMTQISNLSSAVKQNGCSYTLVFFDIDNFKALNDRHGHPAGDAVLYELANLISRGQLREGDFFGRFGGEEFVIILNRCELDDGMKVAERIRKRIESHHFVYDGIRLPVTISMGIGEYNKESGSPEDFFKKVDAAAYVSKRNGKNTLTAVEPLTA